MNIRPTFGQTTQELMKNIPMCNGKNLATDKGQPHNFMENWYCHQNPEQTVGIGAVLLGGILAYKALQRWLPYAKALVQVSKTLLKKGTP